MCDQQILDWQPPSETNGYDDDNIGCEIETTWYGHAWSERCHYNFHKESLPF